MELYLTVAFWGGLIGTIIRACVVCLDHPRVTETSIGADVMALLAELGVLVWVSYLKFLA